MVTYLQRRRYDNGDKYDEVVKTKETLLSFHVDCEQNTMIILQKDINIIQKIDMAFHQIECDVIDTYKHTTHSLQTVEKQLNNDNKIKQVHRLVDTIGFSNLQKTLKLYLQVRKCEHRYSQRAMNYGPVHDMFEKIFM